MEEGTMIEEETITVEEDHTMAVERKVTEEEEETEVALIGTIMIEEVEEDLGLEKEIRMELGPIDIDVSEINSEKLNN